MASIASGILIGTSYIPFPPWAVFFCFVPLWSYWHRLIDRDKNIKKIFWSGWLTQFIFTIIGFHWIAHTTVEFGHLPYFVGVLAVIGYSSFASLHVPISGVIWGLIQKRWPLRPLVSIFTLALVYGFCEILWPTIFPWNLGYMWLWNHWIGFQSADIWGFQGLSILTLIMNGLFLVAVNLRRKPLMMALPLSMAVFLFLGIQWVGSFELAQLPTPDRKIKPLVVQANIGNLEKYLAERGNQFRDGIMDKYFDLTRRGLQQYPDSDLVLYPETAMPISLDPYFLGLFHNRKFQDFVLETKKPFLTGAYSEDPMRLKVYNGMFLFDETAKFLGLYRKTILLAFGEYLPGGELLPFLKKVVPEISDFKRGTGPTILQLKDLKIGPLICYEGLYPWFTGELARRGAQIFVNVTNDSWFGTDFEPYQHMTMTFARTIEYRRPMVRVTNTGITTAVLADGTVLEKSPLVTEWFHQFDVDYSSTPPTTFYEQWGEYLLWLVGLIIVTLVFLGRRKT